MSDRRCRYCGEPSGQRMYCSNGCKQARQRIRDNPECSSFPRRVEIPRHVAEDVKASGVDMDDPDALGGLLAEGVLWRLRNRD